MRDEKPTDQPGEVAPEPFGGFLDALEPNSILDLPSTPTPAAATTDGTVEP